MPRESVQTIRGRALRALAYPVRLELLEILQIEQPATVEELGRALGREPKSLYYHLRPLLRAGLVEEAGRRATGNRPATLYRLAADRLELDPDDRSPSARRAHREIARALFRRALLAREEALTDPDLVLGGRRRELVIGHRVARLTPRGLERVNAKLRELYEILGEEHDAERGRPFALTMHLTPIADRTA